MEMSGQLHALAALTQGKSPWYILNKRLSGPKNSRDKFNFFVEANFSQNF
jgi:hypothetical protein